MGYQQSLFIGPGFTVIIGLVRALSFGHLSSLTALKVSGVLSLAAVPLGVAFVALSFGLGRRVSGVAALLSLTVSSTFGGAGLLPTFGIGLWGQQAATIFVLLAFGGIVRIIRQPTPRRIVGTAAASAAVFATHPVATAALAVLAVALLIGLGIELLLLHRRPVLAAGRAAVGHPGAVVTGRAASSDRALASVLAARRRLVALAGTAAVAMGLAAFQLVPVAAHADLTGPSASFADLNFPRSLSHMWHGTYIFRPFVFALVLVGFAFAVVVSRRRRLALSLVLTPAIFLVITRLAVHLAPHDGVAQQLTTRGIGYAALISVIPLAMLIAAATQSKPPTDEAKPATDEATDVGADPASPGFAWEVAVSLPALLVALTIVLLPPHLDRQLARTSTAKAPFQHAADELRRIVPDDGRYAEVDDFGDQGPLTGVPNPDLWLAWASGRDTLNLFNYESSIVTSPLFTADGLKDGDPGNGDLDLRADALSRLGVTHVLIVNTAKATHVAESPRFKPVWQEGSIVIYEVEGRDGQPPPEALISTKDTPIEAQTHRDDPEHVHIDVTASADTDATLAIAWSPKWHASSNGTSVPLGQSADHLLTVALPAGESHLDLSYGSDVYDAIGRTISVLTLAGAIVWLVRDRRRRRPVEPRRTERVDEPALR